MQRLLPPQLADRMQVVEQLIADASRSREAILQQAAGRLAAAGGKRLRPALVLLAGQFGPTVDPALEEVAASVELLHMATLVHDDIIDDSPTRRGIPTTQAAFGKDVAVFTGDFLLTKALLLLSRAKSDDRMRELARVMVHICEGEVGQFANRYQAVDVLRYLKRIHGKTAALFGLSAGAGARQCAAEEDTCRLLARYGVFLGMAFQIHDDILDYCAESTTVGKPVGHDLLSGVFTLPLLYALEEPTTGPSLRQLLAAIQAADSTARIVALVQGSSGLQRARQLRQRYTDKALASLQGLPDIPAKAALAELPRRLFGAE